MAAAAATKKVDGTPVTRGSHLMDPDDGFLDDRTKGQQWLEFLLMCLCNIAWTIDSGLLPMFFTEFQVLFGVTQTSLAMLSTVKGWVAALFAFPCGFMGELLPRPRLIGLGMCFWAAGLALCAGASSFTMLFAGRMLNGVGLGIVQPLLLSLIADKNPPSKRGSAFGAVYFSGAICNVFFGLVATRYAATYAAGIEGWRWSIAAVVLLSALTGLLVAVFVIEPNAMYLAERRRATGFCSVFAKNMPKVTRLFKYRSFVLILAQGAPGTAPWTIFPFFTQWLELSCFTHGEAALIFATFGLGGAFSNLISGALLNFTARRFPDHGPPSIANFSVASGIPFLVLFFFILPKPADLGSGSSSDVAIMCLCFLLFGLGATMCGTLNKKIFGDIVPPDAFTYIYAIDQLVENTVGNFAGLAMGLVTDHVFHYDASAVKEGSCSPEDAHALGLGMFVVCNIAWGICFCIYTGLHCTYPRDRRAQLEHKRAIYCEEVARRKIVEVPADSEEGSNGPTSSVPSSDSHVSSEVEESGLAVEVETTHKHER